MIDAIVPFADALVQRLGTGGRLADAWAEASEIATSAAQATSRMTARLGRARSHGDKSLGTPDPGAVSFALIANAVLDVLKKGV